VIGIVRCLSENKLPYYNAKIGAVQEKRSKKRGSYRRRAAHIMRICRTKEGRRMEKDVDDFIFEDCEAAVSER